MKYGKPRALFRRGSAAAVVSLALVALLLAGCNPSTPQKAADNAATPSPSPSPSAKGPPVVAPAPAPAGTTVPFKGIAAGAGLDPSDAKIEDKPPMLEFATPRTVGVGKGDQVSFVIQGASIEPRNPESVRVVLLLRMNNRSAYPANLWDASFRLLTHNSVIPANGGLNEVVAPRSDSMLERVQFVVPLTSVPRALQVEHGGESVELPLRFVQ